MADILDLRGGTWNRDSAALTGLSGAATTVSTTSTPSYVLNGKIIASTNQAGGATPTLDNTTGAAFPPLTTGKTAVFVFGWDSRTPTVVSVSQGPIVSTADVANGSDAYDWPGIRDTMCPFAYVTISFVGTSWTFGTSNWNAATTTIGTVQNIATLPIAPLTAAS